MYALKHEGRVLCTGSNPVLLAKLARILAERHGWRLEVKTVGEAATPGRYANSCICPGTLLTPYHR